METKTEPRRIVGTIEPTPQQVLHYKLRRDSDIRYPRKDKACCVCDKRGTNMFYITNSDGEYACINHKDKDGKWSRWGIWI